MSEPFLSEIRMFGFSFAPRGWALCDGQILPINQNTSLFALLGTNFGGDGRTNFGLPDMRGRVPVHAATSMNGWVMGTKTGQEEVVLSQAEMGAHTHQVRGTASNANIKSFEGSVLATGFDARASKSTPVNMYVEPNNLVALNENSISESGGNQGHNNMQPTQVVNFCIATIGLFPSRN